MRLFRGGKPLSTAFPQELPQDFHKLEERISELTEALATVARRLEAAESQNKILRSEWDTVYDKIQRQAERIRKRFPIDAAEDKSHQDTAEAPTIPPPSNGEIDRHKLLALWSRNRGY